MTAAGTYTVQGADGRDLVVPYGEWYRNTKGRIRRMMQNSLSGNARRIYACLELATMGFSQEQAVTMDNGKKRLLLSADIMRQTGLKRQYIDNGFDELEEAGLAERRCINPDIPLQKGNIAIYSWAVPQAPKVADCHARYDKNPEWMPPSWVDSDSPICRLLKRLRISPSPDFLPPRDYISEVEESAAAYQTAEDCLVAKLRLSCAKPSAVESSLLLEKNGKEHNNNSTPPVNGNGNHHQTAPAEEDVVVVLNALSGFGTPTPDAAGRLVQECREARPDSPPSPEEVAEVVMVVARGINRGTTNPVGMLLRQVPKVIATRKPPPPVETEESRRDRESAHVLEHPDEFDEESVAWAKTRAAAKGVP